MPQLNFDGTQQEPPKPMSRGRLRTARQREAIAGGIHPMTRRPLLLTGETCGTCSHLIDGAPYFKCDRMEITRGPATDIRKSWPACSLYSGARK